MIEEPYPRSQEERGDADLDPIELPGPQQLLGNADFSIVPRERGTKISWRWRDSNPRLPSPQRGFSERSR